MMFVEAHLRGAPRLRYTLAMGKGSSELHGGPGPRSRRVLVIEDRPDTASVLETALAMIGLEVRVASDGRSGLELARTFRPEIVLCDLGLPAMDGHEVARAFRRDPELRDAYLIALTGHTAPEDIDRATGAGFSCHVCKPVRLETLVRKIAEAP